MIILPNDLRKNFGQLRRGEIKQQGLTTGFLTLDPYMKLCKGYLAIITGYPSSGKSEFLDAILVNMTLLHGWKIMYYSPENHPVEQHMVKLAEKFSGKEITQLNEEESDKALTYLENHFSWLYPEQPYVGTLLKLAQERHDANGLDCLVIDPWNAVTHKRGKEMLHEYLSEALTKLIRFGRDNNVLICVVAHPTKPQKDKDGNIPVPNLYDISDGAMWRNKADYGLVVHRPDMSANRVTVNINKIKYKWMGRVGSEVFDYDYASGRFKGIEEKSFLLPTEIEVPF